MPLEIIDDGLGEMFKYSILKGEGLFNHFKDYLNSKDSELLYQLISECCKIKLDIVEIDERDQSIRKILNLGHTFGHAIESESKNKISHGIAVINGILMLLMLALSIISPSFEFVKGSNPPDIENAASEDLSEKSFLYICKPLPKIFNGYFSD